MMIKVKLCCCVFGSPMCVGHRGGGAAASIRCKYNKYTIVILNLPSKQITPTMCSDARTTINVW